MEKFTINENKKSLTFLQEFYYDILDYVDAISDFIKKWFFSTNHKDMVLCIYYLLWVQVLWNDVVRLIRMN